MEKMKSDYEYQISVMTNRIKQLQEDVSILLGNKDIFSNNYCLKGRDEHPKRSGQDKKVSQ